MPFASLSRLSTSARAFLPFAIVACGSAGIVDGPGAQPPGNASGESDGGGSGATAGPTDRSDAGSDGSATTDAAPTGADADSAKTACAVVPKCDAPPPDPGPKGSFRHTSSSIATAAGSPNHRGRDLFLNPGDPQWLIGKFAYGLIDKDIKDEDVDIYLLRDCGTQWEKLTTTPERTTSDAAHATVEGVEDTGGRVYFEVPAAQALGLGRHRVRMVVRGDLSTTELFVEVVPKGTPVFVSDVDGTLTTSENEEFTALLSGALPNPNPDAAKDFQTLVTKGFRPMYLTARPEFLVGRTREFLDKNGFPPGIVHTTLTLTGATGSSAATYKTDELTALGKKGLKPTFGFGNTASDAQAYASVPIFPMESRVFFKFTDDAYGGRRIESYGDITAELAALPLFCK